MPPKKSGTGLKREREIEGREEVTREIAER